jgi:hypothetical protein
MWFLHSFLLVHPTLPKNIQLRRPVSFRRHPNTQLRDVPLICLSNKCCLLPLPLPLPFKIKRSRLHAYNGERNNGAYSYTSFAGR